MLIRGTAQLIYKVGASIGSAARLRILRRGQHSDDTSLVAQEVPLEKEKTWVGLKPNTPYWAHIDGETIRLMTGETEGNTEDEEVVERLRTMEGN